MDLFLRFNRLWTRFRYPVSQPEDVAHDLGIQLSNTLTFKEFLAFMASSNACPTHLHKFMNRCAAERCFKSALKQEIFQSSSLYSYYFPQGWVVFALHFDENQSLRRLYFQCPACPVAIEGFDIPLSVKGSVCSATGFIRERT